MSKVRPAGIDSVFDARRPLGVEAAEGHPRARGPVAREAPGEVRARPRGALGRARVVVTAGGAGDAQPEAGQHPPRPGEIGERALRVAERQRRQRVRLMARAEVDAVRGGVVARPRPRRRDRRSIPASPRRKSPFFPSFSTRSAGQDRARARPRRPPRRGTRRGWGSPGRRRGPNRYDAPSRRLALGGHEEAAVDERGGEAGVDLESVPRAGARRAGASRRGSAATASPARRPRIRPRRGVPEGQRCHRERRPREPVVGRRAPWSG